MQPQIKLQNSDSLWSKLLDWNPQLFREIKGRFKTTNVVIAAAISIIIQFVVTISLLGALPEFESTDNVIHGRYGRGLIFYEGGFKDVFYTKDAAGDWLINWQLLWLDLFIILSVIGTAALLIVGTYMLIADMIQEEDRGTINFIRQTPQSARDILLGKVLGVPILLYISIFLSLPLHLMAGLKAQIPFSLILSFDLTIVASCAFFYSIALVWSLTNFKLSGFKPWFASGIIGLFLLISGRILFGGIHFYLIQFSGLLLFAPNLVLAYIIDAAHLLDDKYSFLTIADLTELKFYGQTLWSKAGTGIGLIVANFLLWTYWCWSILQRRFYNPEYSLLSKVQSYWITGWFTVMALGFTIQSYFQTDKPMLDDNGSILAPSDLAINYCILNFWLLVLGLFLIAGLSPHRQELQDWARYRHQTTTRIWQDLILGENSPSTLAVAINMVLSVVYIIPSIFLLVDPSERYLVWGFLLIAGTVTLYAAIAQSILMSKTNRRGVLSLITISAAIVVPPICLSMAEVAPEALPQAWLFSFLPSVAIEYAALPTFLWTIAGQWLAIALISFQMTGKLRRLGASDTKVLFEGDKTLLE